MRIVYLNGRYLPLEEAHVSVMDRGFLFGDGIYEVIPVFNRHFFRLQQHLHRLQKSLAAVRIPLVMSQQEWQAIFEQLIENNQHLGPNQVIYLQITRGAASERMHGFPPPSVLPTVFVQSTANHAKSIEELAQGVGAITAPDSRRDSCYIKAVSLLANVLLYQQALEADAHEVIFVRDGHAIEGASSNLFIVKDGILKTPPLMPQILAGTTRELILEIAVQQQISYQEIAITEPELREADEIWLTGSVKEIYPITKLDNEKVGTGNVGPLWQKMTQHYQETKKSLIKHDATTSTKEIST